MSSNALARGDRIAAIVEAFQGLPPDPATATDTAPAALTALWRAVHSRSLKLDDTRPFLAAVDPSGTRMLLASGEAFTGELESHAPISLVDLTSGETLGQSIPATEADSELMLRQPNTIGFSPDGRWAFVITTGEDKVILLDARTGARHANLTAPSIGGPIGTLIYSVGFSPDSSQFAAASPMALHVWNVATGAMTRTTALSDGMSSVQVAPMVWGAGGEILGLKIDHSSGSALLSIGTGGIRVLSDDLPADAFSVLYSPESGAIAVSAQLATHVFAADGTHVGTVPIGSYLARFVREGRALAIPNLDEVESLAAMTVRVFATTGEELPPRPSDFGGFDHHVFSRDGLALGSVIHGNRVTYVGPPIEDPARLYEAALALLPEDQRGQARARRPVEQEPADGPILASKEFARTADALLSSGDRVGAIMAALKGLPPDPGTADFDTYSDAHVMLFRAVAARVLRADLDQPAGAVVDPTGTRMAVMAYGAAAEQAGPAYLLDTRDGSRVADLKRPDGTPVAVYPANHTSPFSPDGRLLAVLPAEGGRVHLFDAQTGTHVRDLVMPGAGDRPSYGLGDIGFSADGQRYAVFSDNSIWIFDAATGALQVQQPLPPNLAPVGWGAAGEIYLEKYDRSETPVISLHRLDGTTFTKIADVYDASGRPAESYTFPEVSIHSSAIGLTTADGVWSIYDSNGAKLSEVRALDTPKFLRNGAAIGFWTDADGAGKTLQVQDLSGAVLEPQLEDYVPFDQRIFSRSGTTMMFGGPSASATIWRAEGHLRGRALYDLVWENLPEVMKDEVSAERIERPN